MKKYLLFVILLAYGTITIQAQTKADTLAINETIMNYLEGFYTADADRMEKALSPDLAKRVIQPQQGRGDVLQNMTAMTLFQMTKMKPDESKTKGKLKAKIIIFDIFGKTATVKAVTDHYSFIDYCHLGKINGKWKIVNVLWEFKPGSGR